ncbi:MAG: alpha/beta hydrolase [Lachnospiraceae bacterium]|nr:alpha/beta hydrolase [Lachnospiraceae bacterium]
MIEKDYHYLSSDRKTKIHFHEWLPEGHPKAVVQVSHGITEHIGRYHKLASALVEKGYAVAGNDHAGHGESEKPDHYRWEYLVKDTHRLQEYLKQQYPTVPFYSIGFSLGSFVVRDLLAHYPDSTGAAILIGTGFQSASQLSFAKAIAGLEAKRVGDGNRSKFIQALSFGTYNRYFKPNKTEFDWLCESKEGRNDYIQDDACGEYMPAGLFRELLCGMLATGSKESIEKIPKKLPVLLLSGNDDPVGEMGKGVARLMNAYKEAQINDVSVNFYPGRHDILHEACQDHVIGDIVEWLDGLYWQEYL